MVQFTPVFKFTYGQVEAPNKRAFMSNAFYPQQRLMFSALAEAIDSREDCFLIIQLFNPHWSMVNVQQTYTNFVNVGLSEFIREEHSAL